MFRATSVFVLASSIAGLAVAQQLAPRTPGLWKIDYTTTMTPIGGTQRRSENLCITPEVAKRDVAPPLALEEDGWKCRSGLAPSGKERASYAIDCRKDGDRARGSGDVALDGSKAFSGKSRIEADMEGAKVVVVSEYRGRFLSPDCGKAPLMKWEGVTETPRAGK